MDAGGAGRTGRLEEQAELADFLKQISLDRATQARILLTSRRDEEAWLRRIPYRVAMPRMSRADAARLALRIGEERKLDREEVAGWGPLLDYCAGNPLTLRVIAGQAVRTGLRSPAQIAAFIQAVRAGEQPIQDADQRNRIRTLSVSVFTLGQILMEQGSPDCVAAYKEAIQYDQRTQNTADEAVDYFNLGHAYKNLPAIRDLDAAEAAYRRSLELRHPNDALKRSVSLQQIGMVHHERFDEARQRGEPTETVLRHAQAAEQHYRQALALCPPSAVADLGPMHNQLGIIYAEVGQIELAREHFEKTAQYFEQANDHYHAGTTRYNLALMYRDAARREPSPARRDLLRRAAAYAQASLRDYQHYQGRAADREAKAQRLIEGIGRELGE